MATVYENWQHNAAQWLAVTMQTQNEKLKRQLEASAASHYTPALCFCSK